MQERSVTPLSGKAVADTKLDNLWEDMDEEELDELETAGTGLTVPLANGDAAVIKKLSNDDAEENLGLKVQPDGCTSRHISALKDNVEEWTSDVDGSQLPARAV